MVRQVMEIMAIYHVMQSCNAQNTLFISHQTAQSTETKELKPSQLGSWKQPFQSDETFAQSDTCFHFTLTQVPTYYILLLFCSVFFGEVNMINIEPVTIVLQKAGQNSRKKQQKNEKERVRKRINTQIQFDNCCRRRYEDTLRRAQKDTKLTYVIWWTSLWKITRVKEQKRRSGRERERTLKRSDEEQAW